MTDRISIITPCCNAAKCLVQTIESVLAQTWSDWEMLIVDDCSLDASADIIREYAKKDPRIKFFGRVSRQDILTALKKSHLIVINKPTADDYSNYSFSSKILECMASGTPLLTTRVGGMPEEYYDYVRFIDDETPPGIAKAIEEALALTDVERVQLGTEAENFVLSSKNCATMTHKILEFLIPQIN
jgi:glycosyltransferase involved in cell wall biosynthesis